MGITSISTSMASTIGTIDQQNLDHPEPRTSGGFDTGQSFIPTLDGIDFVEFYLASGTTTPDSAYVNVLDGISGVDGMGGPVLGTSNTVIYSAQGVVHFDFPTTIPLTPGQPYVLQLEIQGQSSFNVTYEDQYPGGRAYFKTLDLVNLELFFPGFDLVFTEGLHVPEPSSTCLLGVFAVGVLRKRKT